MVRPSSLRTETSRSFKTSTGRSLRTGGISSSLLDFTQNLYKQNVAAQDEVFTEQVASGLATPEEEAKYWQNATLRTWLTPKQKLDYQEKSRNALEDAQLARLESKVETGQSSIEDLKTYYQQKLAATVPNSDRRLKFEDKIREIDTKITNGIKKQATERDQAWRAGEAKIRNMITLGQASKYDLVSYLQNWKQNLEPGMTQDALRIDADVQTIKSSLEKEAFRKMAANASSIASTLGGDDEAKLNTKLEYLGKALDYAKQTGDSEEVQKYETQLNNANTQMADFKNRQYYNQQELAISQIQGNRPQEIQMKMDRVVELHKRASQQGDKVAMDRYAASYNNLQQSLTAAGEAGRNAGIRAQVKQVSQNEAVEADFFRRELNQINTVGDADTRMAATINLYKKYLFGKNDPTGEDNWVGLRTLIKQYQDINEVAQDANLENKIRDNQRTLEAEAFKFQQVIVQVAGTFGPNNGKSGPAAVEAVNALDEISQSDVYQTLDKSALEGSKGSWGILVETDKFGKSFERPIKLNAKGNDPVTGEEYNFQIGTGIAPVLDEGGQRKYIRLSPFLGPNDDPRFPQYFKGEYKGDIYIRRAGDTVYDEQGGFKVVKPIKQLYAEAQKDAQARAEIQDYINSGSFNAKDEGKIINDLSKEATQSATVAGQKPNTTVVPPAINVPEGTGMTGLDVTYGPGGSSISNQGLSPFSGPISTPPIKNQPLDLGDFGRNVSAVPEFAQKIAIPQAQQALGGFVKNVQAIPEYISKIAVPRVKQAIGNVDGNLQKLEPINQVTQVVTEGVNKAKNFFGGLFGKKK